MTREEAIEILSCYYEVGNEKQNDAMDMAIEALKAQDTAGTTINRQAAIDAVQGIGRLATLPDNDAVVRMSAVEYVLFNLPSAQPEPTTEIQEILDYLDTTLHPIVSPDNWNVYAELHDMVSKLPSAQPDMSEYSSKLWRNAYERGKRDAQQEPSQVARDIATIIENEQDMRVIERNAQSEIIRCKDCRHWDTSWQNDYAPNYHYCPLIDGMRRDDFYCADAERRTYESD